VCTIEAIVDRLRDIIVLTQYTISAVNKDPTRANAALGSVAQRDDSSAIDALPLSDGGASWPVECRPSCCFCCLCWASRSPSVRAPPLLLGKVPTLLNGEGLPLLADHIGKSNWSGCYSSSIFIHIARYTRTRTKNRLSCAGWCRRQRDGKIIIIKTSIEKKKARTHSMRRDQIPSPS
jgi:hypothetical protein